MFEIANPMFAWWAALTVPIVLIYILKVRLRRRPVSTLLFWNQLFDEKKPRAWWQQLRHWLSLLLQLAFVLLLVGALIDPLWSWQRNSQRRIVLILDNSASMKAKEANGTTRLESAKETAKSLARSLRPGDEMSLVSAGGQSVVHVGLTNHARLLIDGINACPETDAPSAILSAISTADRLLKDRPEKAEIIVLTDGCIEEYEAIRDNPMVKLYGVGTARENTAITRYQVRRSLMDTVGYQVLIEVTNSGKDRVETKLELSLEDSLVDVVPMKLEPGESKTRILDHTSASGGKLVAKLDVVDALATDNIAIAILPQRDPLPVTLVTPGSLFLKSVLESMPLVELTITDTPPTTAPKGGLLVIDRNVPDVLPSGRVLIVDPQNACDQWTVGDALEQPLVARVDKDSPLTQHVRLDNVLFPGAKQLTFTNPVDPLIRDPLDSPMLARMKRSNGDLWILTCNLEMSDLPLRIAFPVLIKNAIEWFQGNEGELRPMVPTGSLATFAIPKEESATEQGDSANNSANNSQKLESATPPSTDAKANDVAIAVESSSSILERRDLHVHSPSGLQTTITTQSDQATIGPVMECGLWSVAPATNKTSKDSNSAQTSSKNESAASAVTPIDYRWTFASNLTNRNESDLKPRGELASAGSISMMSLGGRAIWFYLTLLALLLMATEWWLYQRRVVG
jgi:hypothetical protein